jgi:hypothetical protein
VYTLAEIVILPSDRPNSGASLDALPRGGDLRIPFTTEQRFQSFVACAVPRSGGN